MTDKENNITIYSIVLLACCEPSMDFDFMRKRGWD
jgi:hypothetical protein